MAATAGRGGRIAAGVAGLVALVVLVTAAIIGTIQSSGAGSANPVATIRVVDETYRIELANPEVLEIAEQLLAKEIPPMIPNGLVVRGDPGPNAPWSWHIDPASLEWADMTTEVCDGLPSFVEDGTVTSEWYCPWSAEVIAISGGSAIE
ncbi:MAG TPA: hypothetical protein VNQ52_05450 [Microbacteriaceae bacterium]|nr:hypothetical protein [Microbacteriaceae bacterium]